MPKVLIAGEKAFAVHSFTKDELNAVKISETRNDSVVKIGKVFDQVEVTMPAIDSIKSSVIMLLKQSKSYGLIAEDGEDFQGYVLGVFKGKTLNGKRNYIASWLGKMPEEAVSQNPQALLPQMLKGFQAYLTMKDYHKKSVIHDLIKN
ncbi:MAG: hypothetical protein QM479_08330 [Pseudomonadota bacterium]